MRVLCALILSIGIFMAGFFISQTAVNANVGANTVEVRGLSERRVKADRAYWSIEYNVVRRGNNINMADLYKESDNNQKIIIDFLKESGFTDDEIQAPLVRYEKFDYRDNQQRLVDMEWRLKGFIGLDTKNVDLVNATRVKIIDLNKKGVELENQSPNFYFTSLNDIKPEMVKEATINARNAAEELASYANVQVGTIKKAVQGSFVIQDVGNKYMDDQSLEKNVRLVTTITFFLK